jgi:hypothetical protein
MALFAPFLKNSLYPRFDNGLNRGGISGLSVAAIGVLVTAFGAFGGWEYWQRRLRKV